LALFVNAKEKMKMHDMLEESAIFCVYFFIEGLTIELL